MTDEPPQDDPRRATPPPGPTPGGPPPGAPQPGPPSPGQYGPPPGYGPPPQSGPPPGYGAPRPYGPPSGYGTPPPAGPPPGYGAPPPAGYGQPPAYGQPPPYGPPGYGQPTGYGGPPPAGYGVPGQPADPRWGGAGARYPSPGPGIDFKAINPFDWGIMGAGLLALIFSFFSYYTASVRVGGVSISDSESAWHGFFGWFAAIVAFLAAAILAIALLVPHANLPFPHRLATVAGFAVATVSVLLALLIFPHSVPSGSGISTGRGVGYWLSLIVILVGLALSIIRMRDAGHSPGRSNGGRRFGSSTAGPGGTPSAGGPPTGPPPGSPYPSSPPAPPSSPRPPAPPGATPNPPPG
jgi:hypothetical protein